MGFTGARTPNSGVQRSTPPSFFSNAAMGPSTVRELSRASTAARSSLLGRVAARAAPASRVGGGTSGSPSSRSRAGGVLKRGAAGTGVGAAIRGGGGTRASGSVSAGRVRSGPDGGGGGGGGTRTGGSNRIAGGCAGGGGTGSAGAALAGSGSRVLNAACTVAVRSSSGPSASEISNAAGGGAPATSAVCGFVRSMTPRNRSAQAILAASNSSRRVRAAASFSVALPSTCSSRSSASMSSSGTLAAASSDGAKVTSSPSRWRSTKFRSAMRRTAESTSFSVASLRSTAPFGSTPSSNSKLPVSYDRTSERMRSTLTWAASPSSRWFTKPVSASTFASGLPGPIFALTSSSCSGVILPLSIRIEPSWSRGSFDDPNSTRPPRK